MDPGAKTWLPNTSQSSHLEPHNLVQSSVIPDPVPPQGWTSGRGGPTGPPAFIPSLLPVLNPGLMLMPELKQTNLFVVSSLGAHSDNSSCFTVGLRSVKPLKVTKHDLPKNYMASFVGQKEVKIIFFVVQNHNLFFW